MVSYKRHHYVPRCYLRFFAQGEAHGAINLLNVRRRKVVLGASVKGQCAKDYLYGRDPDIEHSLQRIEGLYAEAVRKITAPDSGEDTQADSLEVLRGFALMQYARTDMALRRLRMFHLGMNAATQGAFLDQSLDMSDATLMRASLLHLLETRQYADDLKVCIFRNQTHQDFVTSDDPAILANKFFSQRVRELGGGLISSGVLFFCPLRQDFNS